VNKIVIFVALLVVGCAGSQRPATIRGADLYAVANDLREHGEVTVSSSRAPVKVQLSHYLVDHSRDQIFHVRDVVAGCYGHSFAEDTDCTLALMRDQRFVVLDHVPQPKQRASQEGGDISEINKARIVVAAAGVAMAVGAAKCDAFDGCGTLLGVGAGIDALLLLVLLSGPR
jgi:hypothetical protein